MDKNSSAYSMCLNVYCISRKSCPIFIVYLLFTNERDFLEIQFVFICAVRTICPRRLLKFSWYAHIYSFKISRTYCMFFYESLFTAWSTFQLEVCVYVYGLHTVELRSFIYLRRPPCFPILLYG